MHRLWLGGLTAVALTISLTGCSGTRSVGGDKVAKQVSEQLTKKVGKKPDDVTCPKDLKAEKGAKTRCTLTGDGQKYGVTVTTTSAKDGHVKIYILVDQKAMS